VKVGWQDPVVGLWDHSVGFLESGDVIMVLEKTFWVVWWYLKGGEEAVEY